MALCRPTPNQIIENEILPIYYDNPKKWIQIIKNGMGDISYFDSSRMVTEYYEKMYNYQNE